MKKKSLEKNKYGLPKEKAGKIDRKRMTTAIGNYVPESKNKKFAYPRYTNLAYKALFGKDAKTMRNERGFTKNDI